MPRQVDFRIDKTALRNAPGCIGDIVQENKDKESRGMGSKRPDGLLVDKEAELLRERELEDVSQKP